MWNGIKIISLPHSVFVIVLIKIGYVMFPQDDSGVNRTTDSDNREKESIRYRSLLIL